MNTTALVKYYNLDRILIRKALEIYTRNEIRKRPADLDTAKREEHDKHLAWIRHHAGEIRNVLSRSFRPRIRGLETSEYARMHEANCQLICSGNLVLAMVGMITQYSTW